MKKIAKILSMILALIFVVSAFAACQTPDDPAKESGNNQGSETDPVIETDPPKDPLQLTEGDTCKYTIVRPMNAGDAVKNASVNIKNALSEAIGGNAVSISEDFLASNMKPGEFEILVGNTNREESAKAIEGFKYFDYAIVIEGSKLVINGRDEAMVAEAVKHFISMIEAAEGDIIFNDGDQLGIGYGKETCNAAGRFLIKRTNEKIADIVSGMFGLYSEEKYENRLKDLLDAVVEHVEGNPDLRQAETEDMFDYFDKDEDVDDYEDEEEEW